MQLLKLTIMRKILTFIATVMITLSSFAQNAESKGCYTKEFSDKALVKRAVKWKNNSKKWRGPFKKAKPHFSVNAADFFTQYQKNEAQWKALFKWLQDTDLLAIPAGKHMIDGTEIKVSVEDSKNEPLEKRRSESHYHTVDFMLVVKGVERFGVIDHETSKPNCKYRPDVIHYDYDVNRARFYDSKPDEFFIFFPGDWHIAKVANDSDDQVIRVIVAKLKYVE